MAKPAKPPPARVPRKRRRDRPGTAYQELVASVVKAFDRTAEVRAGEWVEGPDGRRDMDVSVRGTVGGKPILTVIECKDFDPVRNGRVGISFIDALDFKET